MVCAYTMLMCGHDPETNKQKSKVIFVMLLDKKETKRRKMTSLA